MGDLTEKMSTRLYRLSLSKKKCTVAKFHVMQLLSSQHDLKMKQKQQRELRHHVYH